MSKKHKKNRKTQHSKKRGNSKSAGKGLHRDWRVWVVVGLMLAAMLVYVLSDDEMFGPSGPQPQDEVPAEADGA